MNILILDTETQTTTSGQVIHDLGYIIFDSKTKEIIKESNVLIQETWKEIDLLGASSFLQKYLPIYKSSNLPKIPWEIAMGDLNDDIRIYNVNVITAYNSSFDIEAIKRTSEHFKNHTVKLKVTPVLDLLALAREYFNDDPWFKEWSQKHKSLTTYGKPKMSAEAVYQYIIGDPNFVEAHTALEDCKIEMEIYNYLMD